METSILKSTKKVLGLDPDYTPFDQDVITHINASFSSLNQLGVGPEAGFFIEDDSAEWDDYEVPEIQLQLIKTYIYLKCRILFDPPGTSFHLKASEDQIKEYEWRLNTMREEFTIPEEEVAFLHESAANVAPLHREYQRSINSAES
jgi:hypothetical protein